MRSFFCALAFLTRIPVPGGLDYGADAFRKSLFFFPLVGAVLGALFAGSWFFLGKFFPPVIIAALLLMISVLLTGGLHLDGLMDTVDGVYGGRTREEKLAIMKDVHAGSFGVIGVVLVLLLKFSVYTQISRGFLPYLIAAPVLGRQALVWLQVLFPYARKNGLGKLFDANGSVSLFAATTGMTLVILFLLLRLSGLILFLITGVFILLLGGCLTRLLGGLTGDTYGASCELTEIIVLLAAFLLSC
ncbi:cobalamin-5-phosphate synthase CobS [Thermacetogenium phaeum DSM 12270]|uniref:Adenosylcobinamide-GDP ribazoletransferase n=1 Tax=Thermacetogenium phaeum (strain ATCC BAA-254 / DSM 26808 / PB) TaxID=1089553 RepID=K4LH52_THEPS|nr:adenosylcobinamide-GDP ribazoletransferase [Thermacetogenium phaeum]AFV11392.1 cobalamin-5-phosphate synthase CobS [Thermacetogenium phaeum DSM 12270]